MNKFANAHITIPYRLVAFDYDDRERTSRITISDPNTGEIFFGTARRNPNDAFNLEIGYNIALDRALAKLVKEWLIQNIQGWAE